MKLIKVTRNDMSGSYVLPPNELPGITEAELADFEWLEPGTTITLEVVEMSQGDFDALPEFEGW